MLFWLIRFVFQHTVVHRTRGAADLSDETSLMATVFSGDSHSNNTQLT